MTSLPACWFLGGRTTDRAYSVPFPVYVWNPVIPLAHMSGTSPMGVRH